MMKGAARRPFRLGSMTSLLFSLLLLTSTVAAQELLAEYTFDDGTTQGWLMEPSGSISVVSGVLTGGNSLDGLFSYFEAPAGPLLGDWTGSQYLEIRHRTYGGFGGPADPQEISDNYHGDVYLERADGEFAYLWYPNGPGAYSEKPPGELTVLKIDWDDKITECQATTATSGLPTCQGWNLSSGVSSLANFLDGAKGMLKLEIRTEFVAGTDTYELDYVRLYGTSGAGTGGSGGFSLFGLDSTVSVVLLVASLVTFMLIFALGLTIAKAPRRDRVVAQVRSRANSSNLNKNSRTASGISRKTGGSGATYGHSPDDPNDGRLPEGVVMSQANTYNRSKGSIAGQSDLSTVKQAMVDTDQDFIISDVDELPFGNVPAHGGKHLTVGTLNPGATSGRFDPFQAPEEADRKSHVTAGTLNPKFEGTLGLEIAPGAGTHASVRGIIAPPSVGSRLSIGSHASGRSRGSSASGGKRRTSSGSGGRRRSSGAGKKKKRRGSKAKDRML